MLKQKIKTLVTVVMLVLCLTAVPVTAQSPDQADRQSAAKAVDCSKLKGEEAAKCKGTNPNIGNDCTGFSPEECVKNQTFFTDYVKPVVNFLSALVAVAIVGSIIVGGIQYTTGGDKPEALGAAKKRITNGLVAFLIFILAFSFIQFLIPGGIF